MKNVPLLAEAGAKFRFQNNYMENKRRFLALVRSALPLVRPKLSYKSPNPKWVLHGAGLVCESISSARCLMVKDQRPNNTVHRAQKFNRHFQFSEIPDQVDTLGRSFLVRQEILAVFKRYLAPAHRRLAQKVGLTCLRFGR